MHIGQTGETGTQGNQLRAGSNAGQTVAEQSPQNMRVVEWLVQRKPSEVDRVLQSQASLLNVALKVEYDTRQTTDSAGNVTTHFFAKGGMAFGQVEDLRDVSAKIEAAMHPAEAQRIEGWLAELSVIVAKRRDDEFSENLRIEAYAARLKGFPADVVRAALLDHTWRFWPSWAELSDVCDALAQTRIRMLSIVSTAIRSADQPQPEQPADIDRSAMKEAAAEIMESAGFNAKRLNAVRSAPMARTMGEAEQRMEAARVPHWSETAAPDDPRWEILRKSRIASGMIQDTKNQDAAE